MLDVQKMGYGSRAIDLLIAYFQGEISGAAGPSPPLGTFGGEGAVGEEVGTGKKGGKGASAKAITAGAGRGGGDDDGEGGGGAALAQEEIAPRAKLPPLLTTLADRPAERLHWLGVSFGLTTQLLSFWSRKGFKTCYLRQTSNELTGEHSSILLKELSSDGMEEAPSSGWLDLFVTDYRRRLISLMGFSFSKLETVLAMTLLDPDRKLTSAPTDDVDEKSAVVVAASSSSAASASSIMSSSGGSSLLMADELLNVHLSHHDLKRLDLYARNMVDHHAILDMLPTISRLLFQGRLKDVRLSHLQVGAIKKNLEISFIILNHCNS